MNIFDPFNERLCRDIRNDLSTAFVQSLQESDQDILDAEVKRYLQLDLPPYCLEYIHLRKEKFDEILTITLQGKVTNRYQIALAMWDQELFFELHEYLEQAWYLADGKEKEFLQAMIRAAGTYIHLQRGNRKGARTMSLKAVSSFEKLRTFAPGFLNLDLLLSKLRVLDPVPPKFMLKLAKKT